MFGDDFVCSVVCSVVRHSPKSKYSVAIASKLTGGYFLPAAGFKISDVDQMVKIGQGCWPEVEWPSRGTSVPPCVATKVGKSDVFA